MGAPAGGGPPRPRGGRRIHARAPWRVNPAARGRATSRSEPKCRQPGMIVRAPAERPMILTLALLDRLIVDAGDTQPHQTLLVELPILVAIAAEPEPAVVVPFIGEAHGDAIVVIG